LFANFYYLGPLRSKSSRIYSWAGVNPESVGDDGKLAIQSILSARHQKRKMKYAGKKEYEPFEAIIGRALKHMELIEDYKIKQIENRQDYEVKVKIKGSTEYVGLPDVGFGVSQVLPVIVQLFYAPDDAIIFIEQPEIHLHPKAQTLLADVIIDAINMRENARKKRLQIIIETHSEYLLRRMQRKISEEELLEKDFKAYFAVNENKKSVLHELEVDSYGNILNWPEGFFGDMENDMYTQAMNAMNRRIQDAKGE
jgi:predicted ATPase